MSEGSSGGLLSQLAGLCFRSQKEAESRGSSGSAPMEDPSAGGKPECPGPAKQSEPRVSLNQSRPCPPYAAKSLVGQRFTMEDSWQAVPDLLTVPYDWTVACSRDHLPVASPPADAAGDQAAAGPTASAAGSNGAHGDAALAVEQVSLSPSEDVPAAPLSPAPATSTDPSLHFFAVYDGHGGADVAKHCAKNMHERLKQAVLAARAQPGAAANGSPDAGPGTAQAAEGEPVPTPPASPHEGGLEGALKSAFLTVDQELGAERSAHEVGTTAVVALLGPSHIWVANCGDSRALLCRDCEAVPLSMDHKATRSDEVARVEKAGGYVWWDRVMGELAVSRAIGDHCLRPFVIAEPEMTYVVRRPEDQLVLLASDGLWDVFTNEEARVLSLEKFRGELAKSGSSKLAVKKTASSLAKAALAKGSRDNITVVVVDVRLVAPVVPPRPSLQQQALRTPDGSDADD